MSFACVALRSWVIGFRRARRGTCTCCFDGVAVSLQLLGDDAVKGSDDSGNTGKHGQQGAAPPARALTPCL